MVEKIFRPNMGQNRPNFGQKIGFRSFLEIASLVFANIAYDDKQAWYLTGDGGLLVVGKIFRP